MAAATAGYQTIGDAAPASAPVPAPASVPASAPAPAPAAEHPLPDAPPTAAERLQAVAMGAGAAAVGAKDAVAQLITAPMPDLNVYTEPLNPSAQLTLKDRAQLVLESCRPWAEFADPKAFNAPPASEAKLRLAHNVEIFFYNYIVVGLGLLALYALFHPVRALLLAFTVLAAVLLYIIFPENYVINDKFAVSKGVKHAVMAVLALLVLTVGNVFSLLFLVAVTFLPIVLVHAFLREHSASVPSSI